MSVQIFITVHPLHDEIFQSGPKQNKKKAREVPNTLQEMTLHLMLPAVSGSFTSIKYVVPPGLGVQCHSLVGGHTLIPLQWLPIGPSHQSR